jgi:Lrp/AsnC family transcriptional regulator for asnA, asnC and gidA
MYTAIDIDETDIKILKVLIADARTSLIEIAKKCGISSVSVLNRIKRLKKLGVITGATLFAALNTLGFQVVATVGMETDSNRDEIVEFLKKSTYLIEPATAIGEYDFCALIYAENIENLNEITDAVKKQFGIRKVVVNVWSGRPHRTYENIDLKPQKKGLDYG